MHALIIADLEGIAGVYNLADEIRCKELFTSEIEVCICALKEFHINEITVCEVHDKGDYIDKNMLESYRVKHIAQAWNVSFEYSYDFAMLAGFHGMEGSKGVLAHSFRFDIKEVVSNGIPIGEVEVLARWLGRRKIPVILVIGDIEAAYEACSFNVYRHTCQVKNRYIGHGGEKEYIQTVYKKIKTSIESALKLDFSHCISDDVSPITVTFHGEDETDKLCNSLDFNNCSEFIYELENLCKSLNEVLKKRLSKNIDFIQELKLLITGISKDMVANDYIKTLLNKNLSQIYSNDRSEILSYFNQLLAERDTI